MTGQQKLEGFWIKQSSGKDHVETIVLALAKEQALMRDGCRETET